MEVQLQEDWLDARLREDAPYIDDAGFTARVMQHVPAARPRRQSTRAAILIGITAIACVITFLISGNSVVNSAAFLVAMPTMTILAFALACGVGATAVGTTVALARTRGQRF
jgi:hypothetical protein